MSHLATLEQVLKTPQTILILWMTPELNTLSTSGQSIQRKPHESEEAFIRRGRALPKYRIMFGQ